MGSKVGSKWVRVFRNVDLAVSCCRQEVGAKWVRSDFVNFCQFKITTKKFYFSIIKFPLNVFVGEINEINST